MNFTNLKILSTDCFMSSSLSGITLPPLIEEIGTNSFRSCTNLHELVLPAAVQRILVSAFGQNSTLLSITLLATTPPSITTTGNFRSDRYWYVPAESLAAYKSASAWSSYADHILAIPE